MMLFVKIIRRSFIYLYTKSWNTKSKASISKILILYIDCNNSMAVNIGINWFNGIKVAIVDTNTVDGEVIK